MNTLLLCVWSGIICVDCVRVRGVACVCIAHSFTERCGQRVHGVNVQLPCDTTCWRRPFRGVAVVPCRYPRIAVNVQPVRCGPRVCVFVNVRACVHVCLCGCDVWRACSQWIIGCCTHGLAPCVLIAWVCVVLHVYCTIVYWGVLWRVRVANVHLLCGVLSMLVTAFTRFGCCPPAAIP